LNDELIAAAELGDEAKRFMESDLGKCLIGMAQQEVALAQEALERVNPTDTDKIRGLQTQAKLGRYFEQWLLELLDKGENALEVYKHSRQE
jgi:hypothetical protein